jgi:hypothetical protein
LTQPRGFFGGSFYATARAISLRGSAFDRLVTRPGLFLAVLFGMSLHGLFSMPSAMNYVTPRGVSVVRRLFVMSGIVVFGGLLVVMGGMLEVF